MGRIIGFLYGLSTNDDRPAQHSESGTQDYLFGNLGGGSPIANFAKKSAARSLISATIITLAMAVLANYANFAI